MTAHIKWWVIGTLVPIMVLACLTIGRTNLGVSTVLAALGSILGLGAAADPFLTSVVLNARLPRTLMAMVAGAGLSASGSALQGCFRNPLVGPQTIGVLSGAGFGGSLAIFFALDLLPTIAGAFGFGLVATLFVVWLGRFSGHSSILMLVLAGIVIGAFFAAGTSLLQYIADPERELPQLVFWLMGSFSTANMGTLGWMVGPVLLGMGVLWAFGLRINVLSCGEDEARALGVRVERDRTLILGVVAAICASIVSVAGIVGWVGLVVPHMARSLVGPDHRKLIPASACLGAAFLTAVDTMSRSLTPAEIPIGAITAFIGAPVFVAILYKYYASGWHED
jgi:iron complex transport system permease protein